MTILLALTIALIPLTGCSGTNSNSSTARVVYTGGGLKQVKELAGHRVREIELWDAPDMKDRLGKLLGGDMPAMTEGWLIESPITVDGDTLMAGGCEMNNCGRNQWLLFADVANDNINIHNIKDGKIKSYKEKGDIKLPQAFADSFTFYKASQGLQ